MMPLVAFKIFFLLPEFLIWNLIQERNCVIATAPSSSPRRLIIMASTHHPATIEGVTHFRVTGNPTLGSETTLNWDKKAFVTLKWDKKAFVTLKWDF